MPTVANETPFSSLLPASGWETNPKIFEVETERNEGYDALIPWPGFAQQFQYEAPSVGVLSNLRFLFEGSTVNTHGTGTAAATDRWPHGLVDRLVLQVNGQAAPWNCHGIDLNVLRQARYRSITDSFESSTFTQGATTTLRVMWDIPLAVDPSAAPNVGGLFMQSANSQVVALVTTAAQASVATITGNDTLAITGNFRPIRTWFSIPTGKMSNGKVGMILPDLGVLHGLLAQEETVTATGEKIVNLNRVQGTIARIWQRIENGTGNPSLDLATHLDQVRLLYASNQRPRVYYPFQLDAQNIEWYRGRLPYKAYALDQITESLSRDAIDVENLSDPQLNVDIKSSATVNAGARIHTVYELLSPLA